MPGFGDDDYDDKFPASREGGTFWFRVASGAEFPFSLYPLPPHLTNSPFPKSTERQSWAGL